MERLEEGFLSLGQVLDAFQENDVLRYGMALKI